ncbi:glycoside hydrolase family 3 N-terminal domain-containing protein [Microbacterium sp. 1.5R]|uniref:glycoside hydrolase family 3 N-terminal domain-containing protein n=1 Tax=Microbacterium sp. 1.5R TaxID=1916917 RepID=UPI0021B47A0E|nr:glycoside hydrolase family 3 N-terminal domain-containing protein [Microbacterium sp. 1.5R]
MKRRRAATIGTALLVGLGMLSSPAVAVDAPAPGMSAEATEARGIDERAAELVERMSTAEQAASVVMGHIPTTDPAALAAYMTQGFGGFILMGANVPESGDATPVTHALVADSSPPPLIAIDQEGGIVSRLGADTYPASTTLKAQPVAATSAAFTARAALVARAGVSVNFGTVADVTADPSSFIFGRALGADPLDAAERVAAATTAQQPVVASTLKHFPGHGAAPGDSHHAIPTTAKTLDEWRATDALPFAAGIDAGASLLMFGHLAYTAVDQAPASLSPAWHDIARDELGFEGVIVTDDLGMLSSSGIDAYADPVTNAVAALAAGSDLLLMIAGSTPETAGQLAAGITAAVESGTVPEERLVDAATRVMTLRLQQSAAPADWQLCADCEPVD